MVRIKYWLKTKQKNTLAGCNQVHCRNRFILCRWPVWVQTNVKVIFTSNKGFLQFPFVTSWLFIHPKQRRADILKWLSNKQGCVGQLTLNCFSLSVFCWGQTVTLESSYTPVSETKLSLAEWLFSAECVFVGYIKYRIFFLWDPAVLIGSNYPQLWESSGPFLIGAGWFDLIWF